MIVKNVSEQGRVWGVITAKIAGSKNRGVVFTKRGMLSVKRWYLGMKEGALSEKRWYLLEWALFGIATIFTTSGWGKVDHKTMMSS